jgi:hypothetical protein
MVYETLTKMVMGDDARIEAGSSHQRNEDEKLRTSELSQLLRFQSS